MTPIAAEIGNKPIPGVFGHSLDRGLTPTTAEGLRLSSQHLGAWRSWLIARVSRFRRLSPAGSCSAARRKVILNYESLTWAAGLGPATQASLLLFTVRVPTIHPASRPSNSPQSITPMPRKSVGSLGRSSGRPIEVRSIRFMMRRPTDKDTIDDLEHGAAESADSVCRRSWRRFLANSPTRTL